MKIKFSLILLFLLCLFMRNDIIHAVSVDSSGESQGVDISIGCGAVSSCWSYYGAIRTENRAPRGFRLSLYKLNDNSTITRVSSKDFINDQGHFDFLTDGNNTITHATGKYGKIDYKNGQSFSTKTSTKIDIVNYSNYFGSSCQDGTKFCNFFGPDINDNSIKEFVINKLRSSSDNKINAFYDEIGNNNLDNYYLVLEPVTMVSYKLKTDPTVFYGTLLEHILYVTNNNLNYKNVEPLLLRGMPHGAKMTTDKSDNNPDFSFDPFLKAAKFSDAYLASDGTAFISETDILTKTYGMMIFRMKDYEPPSQTEPTKRTCTTDVSIKECDELTVKEPTNKACVLGNNKYSYPYTDSSNIYCTYYISTNFSEFKETFDTEMYHGNFVPIKDLVITNTQTCYIDKTKNNSGWQSSIVLGTAGSIDITIGGRKYTFTGTANKGSVNCERRDSFACTQATRTDTYTYTLNPLVNRYISIKASQEYKTTSEITTSDILKQVVDLDQKQGVTNVGRFSIPLNYVEGTYSYELNFANSFLKEVIDERFLNRRMPETTIGDTTYILTYETKIENDAENDGFSHTCDYEVLDYPSPHIELCPDGTPPPCEKECRICPYECCDDKCNEVPCGNPYKEYVYRPISLIEPFPGILGNGRTPGSNWNKYITINNQEISYSDYYIRNNRGYDGYDIYQRKPRYVITLDYNTMDLIREYNEELDHDYNEVDLDCSDGLGTECISPFLHGDIIKPGGIIDSGECDNLTHDDFDRCMNR